MSEKRFIVETVEIIDCDTGKSRIAKVITDTNELCSCEDLYELCDDLNKLAEKNEQLQKRNKFLEEFDGRAKTVANLKEENEQLRKKLEQIYSFKGLNCRCVNGV